MSRKWLLVFVFLLLGGALWLRMRRATESSGAGQFANETNEGPQVSRAPRRRSNAVMEESSPERLAKPDAGAREEAWRTASFEKNMALELWGKVVDEKNSPLPGVQVTVRARTYEISGQGRPVTSFHRTNVVTAAEGLFEVHGLMGDVLTIENLTKEGYEPDPGALRGFSRNADQQPESVAGNPIVLRMWNSSNRQSLISGEKHGKIIPDGRPYAVDLIAGTLAEAATSEGDLQIRVKRPDNVQRGQRYDWSLAVGAPGGGIAQETDGLSAMYLAPESGYTNTFDLYRRASDNGWGSSSGDVRLYVRMRSGRGYGKVQIAADSFFDGNIAGYSLGDGKVWIRYTVNTNGPRNFR